MLDCTDNMWSRREKKKDQLSASFPVCVNVSVMARSVATLINSSGVRSFGLCLGGEEGENQ